MKPLARQRFPRRDPAQCLIIPGRGDACVSFACGSSFMLNLTSEAVGVRAGVLLRAPEPLEGVDRMQRFLGGPGRLAQAMQIDFRQVRDG